VRQHLLLDTEIFYGVVSLDLPAKLKTRIRTHALGQFRGKVTLLCRARVESKSVPLYWQVTADREIKRDVVLPLHHGRVAWQPISGGENSLSA